MVGEAINGAAAVEQTLRLQPDIVLMDLVMPEMDGIEATRRIAALDTRARVIALTSFVEDEKVILAIQAGAAGFLLKDVTPVELMEAIRATCRGEVRLHPVVVRKLMKQVTAQPAAAPPASAPDLTERETEVIRLVAQGLSNREIAEQLVISEKTVKTHISNLLGKLGLADRTRLAIYAIKNGLAAGE